MDKTKRLIMILVSIIIILLIFLVYGFLVKPRIDNYAIKMQGQGFDQGVEYAISSIIQRAQNCQTVPLFFYNQTINLIDENCLQQNTSKV